MSQRKLNPFDHIVLGVDQALRTIWGKPQSTGRENPANRHSEGEMNESERVQTASLMRINHAGEVCAQALYQGQALTAKLDHVRERMEEAANEENDHLLWCEQRIKELNSHTSYLNPVWYAGSFAIGATAGLIGDRWSLGFVAETEHQVVKHLDGHLQHLPETDHKSRAILQQMSEDEERHGASAAQAGGIELPAPIKLGMKISSKIMTALAGKI
ncbi:MAG: 2-polyprenyl-3-methyl-6-methoxy-1,4-benzoquinone monooxygenase [Gammaproteobacteria bacterium]|nr:2-polyprenyl-3-methyl-6-methoxy-1,4-benzoquinone monooxygenase [Gammaproteobacteria bacterium]